MYRLRVIGRSCALSRRKKRIVHEFSRGVFNITGKWTEKLDRQLRLDVEKYWKDRLNVLDISSNNQANILHHSLCHCCKQMNVVDKAVMFKW